jgi:hypothetical protein
MVMRRSALDDVRASSRMHKLLRICAAVVLIGASAAMTSSRDPMAAPAMSWIDSVTICPRPDTNHLPQKPVEAMPGNPPPSYPWRRVNPAVDGHVLVEVVIDTTGRASMSTFKVLKADGDPSATRTDGDAFADAVRRILPTYRFTAAELDGKKVCQWVRWPFTFLAPTH